MRRTKHLGLKWLASNSIREPSSERLVLRPASLRLPSKWHGTEIACQIGRSPIIGVMFVKQTGKATYKE